MTTSDFERLRAILDADEALQGRLLNERDTSAFVAEVVRVAAEHELVIAEGTLHQAIERGRALWLATLSP